MADPAWADSGAGQTQALPADGMFCRRPGERVGRPWPGPLAVTDHGGPLTSWMGAVIRIRRDARGPPGYGNDPWRQRQEHEPATMTGQLRVLPKQRSTPGSGTTKALYGAGRATGAHHQPGINDAEEQLTQLRGAPCGKTADAAQQLLGNLGHTATLVDQAVRERRRPGGVAGRGHDRPARGVRVGRDAGAADCPLTPVHRGGGHPSSR